MKALSLLIVPFLVAGVAASAWAGQISGTFQYEDRMWDKDGYTGAVQNLPIRFADVEVIDDNSSLVIGSGSTDAAGFFDISIASQGTIDLYVRVLSSTDNSATYHQTVSNNLGGVGVHSAPTTVTASHPSANDLDVGTWVIQDTDGTGIAQAFNILDRGIDGAEWLSQPEALNRYPVAGEHLNWRWSPVDSHGGSFYSGFQITMASPGSGDTDGWSDTVILHEMGHYISHVFHQDDNTGGSHFIGDNFQDPRLSYGEGQATYFCGETREFTAATTGTDDFVSIYADLPIPGAVGVPGGLEFSYDFETGLFGNGIAIGQVGQANETAVTSVMWDLIDGPGTPDQSPGVDDDLLDGDGTDVWAVLLGYMEPLPATEVITLEDLIQGWRTVHGAAYLAAELDDVLNNANLTGFEADSFEPDDDAGTATALSVPLYGPLSPGGGVVINEVELGGEDAVELYNSGETAVDITGYVIEASTNDTAGEANLFYTFGSYVLPPGGFVLLRERGDPANNSATDLYGGPFSVPWVNGGPGACLLSDELATPLDFVRWDGSGNPSTTPVPGGLVFTGNVLSPGGGFTLNRDIAGTDTDDASDFSPLVNSGAQPNGVPSSSHTFFDTGDADFAAMPLVEGNLYSIRTLQLLGAADTLVEIIKPDGTSVVAANDNRAANLSESALTFVAPSTGTFYARTRHVGQLTDYGMYSIRAYEHPDADLLQPPLSVSGSALHINATGDPVHVSWLNGSLYDSVELTITGPTPLALSLAGEENTILTYLDQGVHNLTVEGIRNATSAGTATGWTYAGPILTTYTNTFADANLPDWGAEGAWAATNTVSFSAPNSVTDSPGGDYPDNSDTSLELRVPTQLGAAGTLSFQHICITEAFYDYGYVEVTDDEGLTWDVLASYDMTGAPGWGDGVANSGDWVEETLSLAAYQGKKIRVRFRLITDAFVTEDGWYIDDITITSDEVTAAPTAPRVHALDQNVPNPFNPRTAISFALPGREYVSLSVYDVRGRRVRTLVNGVRDAGRHVVEWDGIDQNGASVASGVYVYRLEAGTFRQTRKMVLVE